jgi:hypothetical protein
VTANIYAHIMTVATSLGISPMQIVENLTVADDTGTSTPLRSDDLLVNDELWEQSTVLDAGTGTPMCSKSLLVKDGLRERSTMRNDLVDALCVCLKKKATAIGLNIFDKKGLHWSQLLHILADKKAYIDNYPDILIPGKGFHGIRTLMHEEQQILLDGLNATHHQCTFKRHSSTDAGKV